MEDGSRLKESLDGLGNEKNGGRGALEARWKDRAPDSAAATAGCHRVPLPRINAALFL